MLKGLGQAAADVNPVHRPGSGQVWSGAGPRARPGLCFLDFWCRFRRVAHDRIHVRPI